MGFGPFSHVHECVSRLDISCVGKRGGCRFSWTRFGFVPAYPRALSDVTHSVCGPQCLKDVYELICPLYFFGIPKRVKRLVQLELEHKGLFGTSGTFSGPLSLYKSSSRSCEACGKVWVLVLPRMSTYLSHAWTFLALKSIEGVDSRGPSLA